MYFSRTCVSTASTCPKVIITLAVLTIGTHCITEEIKTWTINHVADQQRFVVSPGIGTGRVPSAVFGNNRSAQSNAISRKPVRVGAGVRVADKDHSAATYGIPTEASTEPQRSPP